MILLVLVCRFFGLLVVTCHTVDALMPVAASVVGTLSVAASSARDLQDFPIASRRALKSRALFIFTIQHPCFWRLYGGYALHRRSDYILSSTVNKNFKIQKEIGKFLTAHFYHFFQQYFFWAFSCRLHCRTQA